MSLSAAGLLSAAVGAIPATAVGSYTFRISLTDSVPTTVFLDYTIQVEPHGYDTVPPWLIDPSLRSLESRVPVDPVIRELSEIHFFRGMIGPAGSHYAHYDEDIYCLDWVTPGFNTDLRSVLNALYVAVLNSIRTINTIPPDGVSNFTIQAGSGIVLNPIPNGLEIEAVATGGIGESEVDGDVAPWSTLSLVSADYPDSVEAWIKDELHSEWNRASDLSNRLVKYLNDSMSYTKYSAMALGDDGTGKPVVHTIRDVGMGSFVLERYDGLTMAPLETYAASIVPAPFVGPGPMISEPLLIMDPVNNILFIFYIYQAAGTPTLNSLAFCAVSATNYSAGISQATVNFAGIGPDTIGPNTITDVLANDASADDPGCTRLFVTYDATVGSPRFYVALKAQLNAGLYYPILAELLAVPSAGVILPYQVQHLTNPPTPMIDTMDVLFDKRHGKLWWLVATNRWAAAGGNLDLYATIPSPAPGAAAPPWPLTGPWVLGPALTINTSLLDGMEFVQAMMGLDSRVFGQDSMTISYIMSLWKVPGVAPPTRRSYISTHYVRNLVGPPAIWSFTWFDGLVTDYSEARFGRYYPYAAAAPDECSWVFLLNPELSKDQVYLKRYLWDQNGFVGERTVLNYPDSRGESGRYSVVRTAATQGLPNLCEPRGYASLGWDWRVPYFAIDSLVCPDCFRIYYDEPALNVIFENRSPFTWKVKMKALVNDQTSPPENLLIACYQLSEAMRNYHTAATWFPSPSAVPGVQVNWTEAQLAAANVGGFMFGSYYSVTPGQFDLMGGSVAAGRYFADEAATTSQDYTFVFRYVNYPAAIVAAETAIRAAIDAYLIASPPLPHGTGVNPNFYTLSELDAILLTSFATTYVGPPYDYYRYFLFTNTDGLTYEDGYFSANFVDTGVAYGPHPASGFSIPVAENFTVTVPGVGNVSDFFGLSTSVSAAMVYVNGILYLEGIDWKFSGMNTIEYLNRQPGGFVLTVGSVVTVMKWNL